MLVAGNIDSAYNADVVLQARTTNNCCPGPGGVGRRGAPAAVRAGAVFVTSYLFDLT